ncbi:MAG: hypothetical protein ACREC3_10115 [Methyloceanibacter sp.]
MEFDETGELLSYWECSLDGGREELTGGGINRSHATKLSKALQLSDVQIDVLLLGLDQKLDRSSMGWSYDDRVNWSDPVRIYRPATIKALWRRGLLVGNFNDPRGVGHLGELAGLKNLDGAVHEHSIQSPKTPKFQVWTSPLGREVLEDMGLLPEDNELLYH